MGRGKTGFDEPTPSIAPLIDVSFLLLIFFLVTTTILERERDLGIAMTPTEGEVVPMLPIVVGVEGDGSILLNPGVGELLVSSNAEERSLPVLEKHLAMIRAGAGERVPVVQLRVEEKAHQQRVVDVLNCLAKTGVTSVALVD